tara:strand:+ start:118 stop:297 length:180 start_codon:yes stop_codon:yes gene_type:complete
MNKNIRLTPAQKTKIDMLLKNAKFTRLTNALLKDKTVTADEKAHLIFALKSKMFGNKKH